MCIIPLKIITFVYSRKTNLQKKIYFGSIHVSQLSAMKFGLVLCQVVETWCFCCLRQIFYFVEKGDVCLSNESLFSSLNFPIPPMGNGWQKKREMSLFFLIKRPYFMKKREGSHYPCLENDKKPLLDIFFLDSRNHG